jgi:hypothetical protein
MGDLSHHDFPQSDVMFEQWNRALARLREADATFIPIRNAFDQAEQAYFRLRAAEKAGDTSGDDLAAAYAKIGLDDAVAKEREYGHALHLAAQDFFQTPAPHLSALIEKVELIETIGYEGSSEALILADLRRLVRGSS